MARCCECWYEAELCACHRQEDDGVLARDYLVCLASNIVHPTQKANAERWVRLVSLRETGDPSRLLPRDPRVRRAALDVTPTTI